MYVLNAVVTLTIYCAAEDNIEMWEASYLSAVTHFEGIEEFYSNLRREQYKGNQPIEPTTPGRKIQIRKEICESILTSHFFRMHRIVWLNTELESIRKELREKRKDIFYAIFEEYEYETCGCVICSGYGYDYRNRYKKRRVRVYRNEEGEEYGIACVGMDQETRAIKGYFISQPYNVNGVSWSYPLAGRFIFSDGENDSILTIVALAEDPALEWSPARIFNLATLHYAVSRKNDQPAESADLDPVCSLSPARKLRICASIFGIKAFRDKVIFSPTLNNVQIDCLLKFVKVICVEEDRFAEWVIGCNAFTTILNQPITYYVSRGTEANSIFVFLDRGSGGDYISVFNVCNNVSVVDMLIGAEEDENNGDFFDLDEAIWEVAQSRRETFLQEDVED